MCVCLLGEKKNTNKNMRCCSKELVTISFELPGREGPSTHRRNPLEDRKKDIMLGTRHCVGIPTESRCGFGLCTAFLQYCYGRVLLWPRVVMAACLTVASPIQQRS